MAHQSYDQREGEIWYDGAFIPWVDAKLHVLSHALHYASAVFEGLRAYEGRIFKLAEHTDRLFESARILDIEIPHTPEEINAACQEALVRNNLQDAYIRPIVWRGSEQMGVRARGAKVHVAIAAWDWGPYFDPESKQKGLRLYISKWRRPHPDTAPYKAKAAGLYMICTLSKHAAEDEGYKDALMLDWRGRVAEATGANIFFVDKEGQIHTPLPDCFLDGITRRTVIELAKARGIPVIERAIMPEEMGNFEQCFLTGTAAEVTPVSEIAGEIDGKKQQFRFTIGEITRGLMADYDKLVRNGDG